MFARPDSREKCASRDAMKIKEGNGKSTLPTHLRLGMKKTLISPRGRPTPSRVDVPLSKAPSFFSSGPPRPCFVKSLFSLPQLLLRKVQPTITHETTTSRGRRGESSTKWETIGKGSPLIPHWDEGGTSRFLGTASGFFVCFSTDLSSLSHLQRPPSAPQADSHSDSRLNSAHGNPLSSASHSVPLLTLL